MQKNSVEVKRHILNSAGQPHKYTGASVTHVEMAFAGYMAAPSRSAHRRSRRMGRGVCQQKQTGLRC